MRRHIDTDFLSEMDLLLEVQPILELHPPDLHFLDLPLEEAHDELLLGLEPGRVLHDALDLRLNRLGVGQRGFEVAVRVNLLQKRIKYLFLLIRVELENVIEVLLGSVRLPGIKMNLQELSQLRDSRQLFVNLDLVNRFLQLFNTPGPNGSLGLQLGFVFVVQLLSLAFL